MFARADEGTHEAAAVHSNGAAPLATSLEVFSNDLTINTTSAYSAAQEAVKGFEQLPECAKKTFIYTGNMLYLGANPALLSLGVGKAATAHVIQAATMAYQGKGYQ